jgi:dihydroxyacid dehydratase/phosphogluconate dehydratase
MVEEDLKPSDILTRAAFLNAIKVNTAIGGSTNAPPHLQAIARHIGVELDVSDWQTHGHDLPLLVNLQPAGEYLGESFFRAGGVPAVIGELLAAGQLDGTVMTATGQPMAEAMRGARSVDATSSAPFHDPLRQEAGFLVLSGNLFDSAIDEDLGDLAGVPDAVPPKTRSAKAARWSSRGPRITTRGSMTPTSPSGRMRSSSSATWAAWAIPDRRRL